MREILDYNNIDGREEFYTTLEYPRVVKGLYLISNTGQCFSIKTKTYLKGDISKDGYRIYSLKTTSGKTLRFSAHRLTAYTFCEGYEDGLVVNHIDANKTNNYYTNLEWTSVLENTRHAYKNNLIPIGTDHHKNVYDEDTIRKICSMLEKGIKRRYIYQAIKDDVPSTQSKANVIDLIKRIRSRKTWKQISKDYTW